MSNKDVKCLGDCKKRDDGKTTCRTKGKKWFTKKYKEYQDCNPDTGEVIYLDPELVYNLYEAMKELEEILPDNLKYVLLQVQKEITNMINANIIDNEFVINFKLVIEKWQKEFKEKTRKNEEIFQEIEKFYNELLKSYRKGQLPANNGNKRMQTQLSANNGNLINNLLEGYFLHGTNLWTFISALDYTDLFLVPGCNKRSVPLVGESAGTTYLNWNYVSTVKIFPHCISIRKALNNTRRYAEEAAGLLEKTIKTFNKNIRIMDITIEDAAKMLQEIIKKLEERINNLNNEIRGKNKNGNEYILAGYSTGKLKYTQDILKRQIEFYKSITPERFRNILQLSTIGIIITGEYFLDKNIECKSQKGKKNAVVPQFTNIKNEVGLKKLKIKYIAPQREGYLEIFKEILKKSFPEENIVSLSELANILLKGNPIEPECENFFKNLPTE